MTVTPLATVFPETPAINVAVAAEAFPMRALSNHSNAASIHERYKQFVRVDNVAATFAALRPLARHNFSASSLYSSVYLALVREGFVNCVFMWASFRVFDPLATVCQINAPYGHPMAAPVRVMSH